MRTLLILLFLVLPYPTMVSAETDASYQTASTTDCDVDDAACNEDDDEQPDDASPDDAYPDDESADDGSPEDESPEEASEDPFAGEVDPLDIDGALALDNAGLLDGIYTCEMTYGRDGQSLLKSQLYVSVNGKSNGDAVFIIGEIEARPDAYFGWGIGRVANETDGDTFHFAGQTSEGQPFALAATYQQDGSIRASGEAVVMFGGAAGKKIAVKTRLSCQSIW